MTAKWFLFKGLASGPANGMAKLTVFLNKFLINRKHLLDLRTLPEKSILFY
jgi:hypothetical protein